LLLQLHRQKRTSGGCAGCFNLLVITTIIAGIVATIVATVVATIIATTVASSYMSARVPMIVGDFM
jgi:hypothetical protein